MDTIKIKIKCADDGALAVKLKMNGEPQAVDGIDQLIEYLSRARDQARKPAALFIPVGSDRQYRIGSVG